MTCHLSTQHWILGSWSGWHNCSSQVTNLKPHVSLRGFSDIQPSTMGFWPWRLPPEQPKLLKKTSSRMPGWKRRKETYGFWTTPKSISRDPGLFYLHMRPLPVASRTYYNKWCWRLKPMDTMDIIISSFEAPKLAALSHQKYQWLKASLLHKILYRLLTHLYTSQGFGKTTPKLKTLGRILERACKVHLMTFTPACAQGYHHRFLFQPRPTDNGGTKERGFPRLRC